MKRRSNKLIALLLTAALMLTMDSSVFAVSGIENEADPVVTEYAGLDALKTTEASSGWRAESDDEKAVIELVSNTDSTDAKITLTDPVLYESKKYEYYECKDTTVSFFGTTDSSLLYINLSSISDNSAVMDNNKKNSVLISVKKGNIPARTMQVKVGKIKTVEPKTYGNIITAKGNKNGISKQIITIETEEGVNYVKEQDSYDTNYYVYTFSSDDLMISQNKLAYKTDKALGDYTITYYSWVPYFGKKLKQNKYSEYIGSIVIKTQNSSYTVEKAKVIRLKNAPKDQGLFPSVSNAGIQILKLKYEKGDKTGKQLSKDLKKATKVNKSSDPESIGLPLIIYPYRLTPEGLYTRTDDKGKARYRTVHIKGKSGKYKVEIPGLKFKFKNGAKDSFKTGVISIEVDRGKGILIVNSADVCTGPDGLSLTHGYVKDETAGK